MNQVASGDDQPYVDVLFGQGVTGVYLIENQGNDSGFMQALDATGKLVGPVVPFTTSDYPQTSYRTANNQIASGLFVWMEVLVFGIRITPPSGGVMGFDPVSVSAIVDESTVAGVDLTELPDFSEFWNGETLVWEKALFTDSGVVGSTGPNRNGCCRRPRASTHLGLTFPRRSAVPIPWRWVGITDSSGSGKLTRSERIQSLFENPASWQHL